MTFLKPIKVFKKLFAKKFNPETHIIVAKPIANETMVDGGSYIKIKLRVLNISDESDDNLLEDLSAINRLHVKRIKTLTESVKNLQCKIDNHSSQMKAQVHYFNNTQNKSISQHKNVLLLNESLAKKNAELNKDIFELNQKYKVKTKEILEKDLSIQYLLKNKKQRQPIPPYIPEPREVMAPTSNAKTPDAANTDNEIKKFMRVNFDLQSENQRLKQIIINKDNLLKNDPKPSSIAGATKRKDEIILKQLEKIGEKKEEISSLVNEISDLKKKFINQTLADNPQRPAYSFATDIQKHLGK